MSQKTEYIQLETGDDVASLRDRLSFIRGKRVLLIWPERGTALSRKLDLVLVQREARRRVLQIALVTHDVTVINHARDLGISTFETVQSAERSRWRRIRSKVFTQRSHRPDEAPEPEELMPVASRVRSASRRKSRLRYTFERLFILLLLALVIGGTAFLVVPAADVQLTLAQDTISGNVSITAAPEITDVDVEGRTIPATILRATVRTVREIRTTGAQNLGDTPAIGVVVFTNQTVRVVVVPEGTVVSTSAGTPIRFRTLDEIRIPGGNGQQVEAAVESLPDSSGFVGNVDAGMINIIEGELSEQVTVRNTSPTTGGASRIFASVTEEDRDELMLSVRQELQAKAFAEMEARLTENQTIILETVRIVPDSEGAAIINYSHEVGDITDTLILDMETLVEAIVIDERFARQVVFAQLSQEKPRGLVLVPESFVYQQGPIVNVENDQVTFTASGTATITGQINTVRLQERIAGLSMDEALSILQAEAALAPDTQPTIAIQPGWLQTLPLLPIRIRIQIETQTS